MITWCLVAWLIAIVLLVSLNRIRVAFGLAPLRHACWWLALVACLVTWASVFGYEAYLEYAIGKFDLNRDGVIDGTESTQAQQDLTNVLINDVGRKFMLVFAPVVFALLSSLIWVFLRWRKSRS